MSPEDVIRSIVARESREEPLSEGEVDRVVPELAESARRHFGTWESALAYAGVDAQYVVRETVLGANAVRDRLARMAFTGSRLDREYVARRDPALVRAAVEAFGGWDSALEAAGIDPDRVERHRRGEGPSADEVLDALRARQANGASMRWTDAAREDNALANLARSQFGSWGRALVAAGLTGEAAPGQRERDE